MDKNKPKIDFIGIGMSRSGSTWINHCLNEHPDICMPKKLKLHWFDNDHKYDKGIESYYKEFKNCDTSKKLGENTPSYLVGKVTIERIYKHFPNVNLFVCLRNPIEMNISRYYYEKGKEQEFAPNFEEAINGNQKNHYLKKGLYYTYLKNVLKFFSKDTILVLIYEDIKKNPVKFIQQIYRHISVDDSFEAPSAKKIINASSVNKRLVYFPLLNKILNYFKSKRDNLTINYLIKLLKITGLLYLLKRLRKLNKKKIIKSKEAKPKIKNETRKMLQEYYRDEIQNLEKLINKNLSHWK